IVPWPSGLTEDEVGDLADRIHQRIKKVLKTQFSAMAHQQDQDPDKSWFSRKLTGFGLNWLGPAYASPVLTLLKGKIETTIRDDLKKRNLLIPDPSDDEDDDDIDDDDDDLHD
ncbi:MAG: hypothetical protein RIB59_00490, partial [Rhodospirillales bacterium]